MIRQPAKKNQTGYDRDYDDFKILKQLADKHNIGLMLIHHTRKMRDPSDVFNELSGSASDIVDASKYLSRQIYDDVRKVGKIINNFEELFLTVDDISYHIKPSSKKNVYIFHSTHSTHSIGFTQMELDM